MSELRECPFCGATPEMFPEGSERAMAQVDCTNQACALRPSVMSPTIADAVYFWNSRPSPWRTGKPEKEGEYLTFAKCKDPESDQIPGFITWLYKDDYWDMPEDFVVLWWMPIPPIPDKGE